MTGHDPITIRNKASACHIWLVVMALHVCGLSGCVSMSNPLADGIPARLAPPELLAPSKSHLAPIPLTWLQQPMPVDYLLGPGDVLGVTIDGILGDKEKTVPLYVGPRVQVPGTFHLPPASGYPVTVEANGTIVLPNLDQPLPVAGKTLQQTRQDIMNAYVQKQMLRPDMQQVSVTLMYPRRTRVMVFRQDSESCKSGQLIELPAFENDVLHVLATSGGLPGLDAYNAVVIYRQCFTRSTGQDLARQLGPVATAKPMLSRICPKAKVIRIPLRMPACDTSPIPIENVLLNTGDVVFLERRDEEVFYTGGLLPSGKHSLPRDKDLDVIEAVLTVQGEFLKGNPPASMLTVLRRLPDGRQVPIIVDLRSAVKHSRERILVQAGDILYLQATPGATVMRCLTHPFGYGEK